MTPRLLLVPLAALLLLLGAACGDDDDQDLDTGTPSTTEPPTTPTTGATVTTGPDSSTVTTAPTGTAGSPEGTSGRLLDAWYRGDREEAASVAEQSAVDDLFAREAQPGWQFTSCRESETVAESLECDYTMGESTLTFLVEGNGEDGYRITQVGFIDPEG